MGKEKYAVLEYTGMGLSMGHRYPICYRDDGELRAVMEAAEGVEVVKAGVTEEKAQELCDEGLGGLALLVRTLRRMNLVMRDLGKLAT